MNYLKYLPTILRITLLLLIYAACSGQSFYPHKNSEGHDKQCHVVHQKKTIGQKLRNKVKYNRKRHNNDWFAYKERQRKLKLQGYATR